MLKKLQLLVSFVTFTNGALQTDFDYELLYQHNKMRADPMSFIPDLEKMFEEYDGGMSRPDDIYDSEEGGPAITELIDFLKLQKGVRPLTLSDEIKDIACAHVNDQGPAGAIGHSSTDGTSLVDRMIPISKPGFGTGEIISFGTTKPRDILIGLAIDDGNESRGNRNNIFLEQVEEFGSCYGEHAKYRDMAVIVYRGKTGSGADYKKGVAPG